MAGNDEESVHEKDGETGIAVEEGRPKVKEPPRFSVIIHNDDYTTMEFVIEVLQKFFHHTAEEATRIMLRVHQAGKGVAGVYTFDIAETKVMQVHDYARSKSFPLKCTLEPAP